MKKIRITTIIAGKEDYPGCRDILATCPEFEIIASHTAVDTAGIWHDLSSSDVILLDETAVTADSPMQIRAVYESFPFIRILLIMDKYSKNKTMEALSMGVTGVMERASVLASIRKAIPVVYSGETWVSRGLVKTLHHQLTYAGDESLFTPADNPSWLIKN